MNTTIRNLMAAKFIALSLQAHAQGTLAYALKRGSKQLILLAGMLLFGSIYGQSVSAQASADSVVQICADAAGLTPPAALPRTGTWWVVTTGFDGRLQPLPYPTLPPELSNLPMWSVGPAGANIFLVDDTGGQIMPPAAGRMNRAQAAATVQAQAQDVAGLIGQLQFPTTTNVFEPKSPPRMVFSNGLWLDFTNQPPYPVGTNLWLRLHGTIDSDDYQLLSSTNLSCTNWVLGEILWGADDDYTDFLPVPMTNAMTFYRAHHANPVIQIWNILNSVEQNPTNNSGQVGIIGIQNGDQSHGLWTNGMIVSTNDITVYYTVGGTAQAGIDYSNLPGVVIIPAGTFTTNILIQPIADGLKPDQTIILTLAQNTNYLIDTDYASTTNTLFANPEVIPTARGDLEPVCPNMSWTFYLQGYDPNNLPLSYSIVTWPTNGTLDTSALPSVSYTATNCYEGQDSFTFNVSNGQFTSAPPATVTLFVSSQVYANPVTAQTCRGTYVGFTLNGGAACGQVSYALLSYPLHGTAVSQSGQATDPNYSYTPTDPNFTGTDSFNYQVIDECGYSATATVSITVGDPNISPIGQTVMMGTNQPVNITLTANSVCANAFDYRIVSQPVYGNLSGAPPNVTYTPYPNFEGVDSFRFTASDGVWTSTNSATVTNFVVAGPILTFGCDPFGTGPFVLLNWRLDNIVQQMEQQYNFISDYNIYRSPVSGGPYTNIYTSTDLSLTSYMDTNVVAGETNYYVATFEFYDSASGITYESPFSNELVATGENPSDLIAADAIWDVYDVSTNHPVEHLGDLQAPFSCKYPDQYQDLNPWPNTYWPVETNNVPSIWSNNIALVIPTNVVLSLVKYSIAIDNDYWLYLNNLNATNYIDSTNHEYYASWAPFKTLAPGLHYGTNNLTVVIRDRGDIDYFSLVVTTNTCGQ